MGNCQRVRAVGIFRDTQVANIEFEFLIKNLSSEEKLLLTLYYCSKYTIQEISSITKIKENTIKGKLARARNKIRNQLEEGEE